MVKGNLRAPVFQGIKEGFDYAFGLGPIRSILVLLTLVSLVGMPYTVLMPVVARDVLLGGPEIFGFLMAGAGVGALVGAAFLASRRHVIGLEKWIAWAGGIMGCGLSAFSLSRWFWMSLALMLSVGFGMMVQVAASNTLLQTIVEDDKRGRVMSFYTMALMGMAPFGSLLAGALANEIGAPHTLMISGAVCLLSSVIFARRLSDLRRMIHPMYVRAGMIPEVASALQMASEPGVKTKM
jgi:MFS family permease